MTSWSRAVAFWWGLSEFYVYISQYQRDLELSRAQNNPVEHAIPVSRRGLRRFFARQIPEEDLQSADQEEASDISEDESPRAPSVEVIPQVEVSSELPRCTRQRKVVSL
mmetsp:Transcript_1988/g.5657  ORF Transcript_1988/g.5657 Transcript_1988/m.5657 type:complete len:109 (-) Transcript_1988:311-637(-)|eukprot:CAMPEP_0194479296 /NCGR_PEP_ID=MMETSP0253-20130528/2469_1 /TAXON_ID=2966 /ORGANISM="Noctiluca scintillans" /LENGTH=108 /DNA_ID=CAMNT_0039318507 /DNA_START=57 /DNA_END=383 /DNA_ORIENTATION=+